jgi:hypothetical protein
MYMFFILFTLGFVAVVMTCMIMINRWMVSKRPKVPNVSHQDPASTQDRDAAAEVEDS